MKANGEWASYYFRPRKDVTPKVTEKATEIMLTLRIGKQQFNITMDWLEASQLADALHAAAAKAEQHAREPGDDI